MGSAHPRAAYVASQEGSSNLNKLFKKRVFSCGFEAVMKARHTNIASINGACPRLTAKPGTAGRPGRYAFAGFGGGRSLRPADAQGHAAARRAGFAGLPGGRPAAILQKPAWIAGPH